MGVNMNKQRYPSDDVQTLCKRESCAKFEKHNSDRAFSMENEVPSICFRILGPVIVSAEDSHFHDCTYVGNLSWGYISV